jgi:hypothetical protein
MNAVKITRKRGQREVKPIVVKRQVFNIGDLKLAEQAA